MAGEGADGEAPPEVPPEGGAAGEEEEMAPRELEQRFRAGTLQREESAHIGVGAMEAEMDRVRAEMEAEITREEEEKAVKRVRPNFGTSAGWGEPDPSGSSDDANSIARRVAGAGSLAQGAVRSHATPPRPAPPHRDLSTEQLLH